MAGETPITIIGNATADAEIKFTSSGTALATVTVASTPRTFDKATGQWQDKEALFLRCTGWRDVAEHMAETITRGMRLIVSGRLEQRSFTTEGGEQRTTLQVQVDEIGPSLRYATAEVRKAQRAEQPPSADRWAEPDPWATQAEDAPF